MAQRTNESIVRLGPMRFRISAREPHLDRIFVQPKYETIVRLGPMQWGMTVRLPSGERTVHELGRVWFEAGF